MINWFELLKSMSDTEYKTAKELGVAAQSLTAMVRRGYVEKLNSAPTKYRKADKAKYYIMAFEYINKHPNKNHYDFYKSNEKLGMMCSIKGNDIMDCYDNIWDLENLGGTIEGVYPNIHRVPFEN